MQALYFKSDSLQNIFKELCLLDGSISSSSNIKLIFCDFIYKHSQSFLEIELYDICCHLLGTKLHVDLTSVSIDINYMPWIHLRNTTSLKPQEIL